MKKTFKNYLEKVQTTGVWLSTQLIFSRNGQAYSGWCQQNGVIKIDAIDNRELRHWYHVYN